MGRFGFWFQGPMVPEADGDIKRRVLAIFFGVAPGWGVFGWGGASGRGDGWKLSCSRAGFAVIQPGRARRQAQTLNCAEAPSSFPDRGQTPRRQIGQW